MAELDDQRALVTVDGAVDSSGTYAMRIGGEIDISNIGILRAAFRSVLDSGVKRFTIDLSGIGFMDSSALAVLLETARSGESLRVLHPSPAARRVIETTGLSNFFELES